MTQLRFAIPSKGRLKENTEAWLAACGYRVRQLGGARGYRAELSGMPDVDMTLLSAREVAQGLIAGDLHVGVTGQDLLHELSSDVSRDAAMIKPLGFGHADVVVAVPAAWLDVETMADLEAAGAAFRVKHGRRLRVATKYLNITRRYFAQKSVGEYRLVESAGATEAAPAAGSADVIVDITSSGATLKANQLKVLNDGVMLRSQAALAGSLTANWSPDARAVLEGLLSNVSAKDRADTYFTLRSSGALPDVICDAFQLVKTNEESALVAKAQASLAAKALTDAGAGPVEILSSDFIYAAEDNFFDEFLQILDSSA